MVMADYYDQRNKKRYLRKEKQRIEEISQAPTMKVPIILSKNPANSVDQVNHKKDDKVESLKNHERLSVLSKTVYKEEPPGLPRNKVQSNGLIPDGILKSGMTSHHEISRDSLSLTVTIPSMTVPTKLISGFMKWTDGGSDFMLDQTNYVVVGVLGLQNVGKSMVLSYLGDVPERNQRLIFKPQIKGTKESGVHVTTGVDMFITKERMILLDCQALLSVSSLNDQNRHERKHSAADLSRTETGIDVQSIQLAAFMMSVCNFVIVVMDWFVDDRIFEILRLAEMLKPPISYDDAQREEHASLIFALNKARTTDHSMKTAMKMEIEQFMKGSRLVCKGKLHQDGMSSQEEVNLVVLPHLAKDPIGKIFSKVTKYKGCSDFEESMKDLTYQLITLPRKLPINKFSEKKWLMYASRAWNLIRKSSPMCEYDRLLS